MQISIIAARPWRTRRGAVLAVRAMLATLAFTAAATAAPAAPPIALRLIGLNDFHGNLEAVPTLNLALPDPAAAGGTLRPQVGGAAALAGLVQALRAGSKHSLMLASGDLIGAAPLASTLFRHESTIAVMNAIGLEVAALGNHEFDGGLAELQRIAAGGCAVDVPGSPVASCNGGPYAGARFPLLAANVIGADGQPVFAPYVIKRYGGVRVGIIGAVTRTTPSIVLPSGVAGLRFIDEAQAINRAARELRAKGVRAMVLSIHEGGVIGDDTQRGDWNDSTCPGARGPIFDIARQLTKDVSIVFSAHTHQGYRCVSDGRTIIQATFYGRGLAVVDTALSPRTGRFISARTRSINLPVFNAATDPAMREKLAAAMPAPFDDLLRNTRPDAAVAAQVARYTAAVAPQAERPVGRIAASFTRAGPADSAAGRLVADAQWAATREPAQGGAQLALMNPGGIRSDLECSAPPCTVSFGQAFTMQPFGNSLVVMTLSGAQLKALLEAQARAGEARVRFLSPSAGFGYTWKADAPLGERVRDLRLHGEPVLPERDYRVTVNSFLAEGGDGFLLLREGRARTGGGQDIDAMLAHLATGATEPLAPVAEPRVQWLP